MCLKIGSHSFFLSQHGNYRNDISKVFHSPRIKPVLYVVYAIWGPAYCIIVIRVFHSLLQGQGSFHDEATLGTPVTPLTPATPATPDPPPAPVAREKSNSADVVQLGVFKL